MGKIKAPQGRKFGNVLFTLREFVGSGIILCIFAVVLTAKKLREIFLISTKPIKIMKGKTNNGNEN